MDVVMLSKEKSCTSGRTTLGGNSVGKQLGREGLQGPDGHMPNMSYQWDFPTHKANRMH